MELTTVGAALELVTKASKALDSLRERAKTSKDAARSLTILKAIKGEPIFDSSDDDPIGDDGPTEYLVESLPYEPEIIRTVLTHTADLAVWEAEEHRCNMHRAAFFHDLICLELEQ